MRFLLLLFSFLFIQLSFGQSSIPTDYFISPLNVPLSLSGNFGELRDNHFHSGLDIRTQQRNGLKVNATADGYVSRVKIGLYGYGNVIYVQHPNGYTTVYAHLQEFSPKIRAYVKKRQYAQKKNTIELFPGKNELPVEQGEVIALSGESGGAGGPHLHYEIRDAQQRPMNPLLFGIQIADNRPPVVSGLYVYPQNENSHVNQNGDFQKLHLYKTADGNYKTETIEAYGKLGFGVDALDYTDNAPFTNGIYDIQTCLNGEPQLDILFNKFSFANTRYINRYIDYSYYRLKKSRIQKLFIEPNNLVDMSIDAPLNGYITIQDNLDYKYEIVLKDYSGNKTHITIPIKAVKENSKDITREEEKTTDYYAQWNKPNVFDLEYHDVYIPKNALYENTYLDLEDSPGEVKVHHFNIPLHRDITIGFDASQYKPEDREKLYVARVMPWGQKYYSSTYKDGTRITTKTKTFGDFRLERDDTPPTITPLNFRDKKWVSELNFLKLKIKDNESGIDTYYGTINGQFIVLEYDYKTDQIQYDFRDKISNDTENNLKIIVVDNVGNSSTFEATFYRKEQKS